ncbi:Cluster: Integral membrane protein [Fervidicoccus fontis Kam940]|uniref:Cluster: Integral membrane protein n=1 Tax=Fervidicoccus fontis (strain DSM 19380 / JCM 18336 / VKM B-2539 / Kam940) TaxID=1163730 RepID=I0A2T4_FERFK|nr:Cluster: Integral membrane protein [Fervidicoccus fontis Kam940]
MKLSLKKLMALMIFLFLIGGILGYLIVLSGQSDLISQLIGGVGEKAKTINFKPFSPSSVLAIFVNNLTVSLISILSGLTVVIPSFIVLANGIITGLVVGLLTQEGLSVFSGILSLMPHGIFELTAIFLSAAYGTSLGVNFWKFMFRRENNFFDVLKKMPKYVLNIVILLLIAAVIEVFISPLVLQFLLNSKTPVPI